MKLYILAISILFLIATYFFITNDDTSINQNKVISDKANKYIKSIDSEIEKEKKIDYNKDNTVLNKMERIFKQVEIEEYQKIQLFDENTVPLDLLEKIFLFKNGKKDDILAQQKIVSLESTLISKLQTRSEQDDFYIFKKLLDLEETSIEDKKYIIDLLERINTHESKVLLVEIYTNSDEEELKNQIKKSDTPEVYTLLALEANQNDDTDNYQLMMNKLKDSDDAKVINGFMAFSKSDDSDSLDHIIQLTSQWSSNNLSQKSTQITEDYLSRADSKLNERMIAISILSNIKNIEERDRIFTKALEHEDNEDILNFIQTILDNKN